jgi:ribosomal protein S18 acetylase RimI-like enzyme
MWWMLFRVCGLRRMRAVRAALRALGAAPDAPPHLDLRYLAVDPAAQGRGLAGALLREGLARADAAGLPVALHCTKAHNVALYEHFGFAVRGVIDIPAGPPMWDMWREAPAG